MNNELRERAQERGADVFPNADSTVFYAWVRQLWYAPRSAAVIGSYPTEAQAWDAIAGKLGLQLSPNTLVCHSQEITIDCDVFSEPEKIPTKYRWDTRRDPSGVYQVFQVIQHSANGQDWYESSNSPSARPFATLSGAGNHIRWQAFYLGGRTYSELGPERGDGSRVEDWDPTPRPDDEDPAGFTM